MDRCAFGYNLQNNYDNWSCTIIADIDGDFDEENNPTLEIVSRTYDEGEDELRVFIREMGTEFNVVEDNELNHVEWSQLQNGPRHTGLYAQPYAGHLPEGQTYWRDRVIVVSNVYCGHADVPEWDAYLIIEDNSVIEFNDGKYVSDNAGYVTMGSNVVLKPNVVGQENDWCFIGQLFEWTDDVILNGAIELEEGGEAVFTNCTFINDDASGLTAFTAEDADVDFINCTFKGYDTALLLDDCVGTIEGCTFEDMTYNAIELENCTAALTIEECVFNDNGGAAMYFYNSNPEISDCDEYNRVFFVANLTKR